MRPSIDDYYMGMAFLAAERAGCPSRKVGAIVTDNKNRVLGIGYNSPPGNLPTCHEVYCGKGIDGGECLSSHGEMSAITSCRDLQSAKTIYITCSPCLYCTKLIMTTPIERIVFAEYHDSWAQTKRLWNRKVTYMESWDPTKNHAKILFMW
jgi:dCMP deaminase